MQIRKIEKNLSKLPLKVGNQHVDFSPSLLMAIKLSSTIAKFEKQPVQWLLRKPVIPFKVHEILINSLTQESIVAARCKRSNEAEKQYWELKAFCRLHHRTLQIPAQSS